MDYIWNNWSQIMDWLALEPVTNWLSIGLGYVAGCVTLVTLSPVLLPRRTRLIVFGFIGVLAAVAGLTVMFQAHEILNAYQAWYSQPLGPGLDL